MATPTSALGFQNFFEATLTGDITASSTDILMDNIPNSSQGFLVIEPDSESNREVIFYTSKTALKVVCGSAADGRGQDDTTAVAHSTGATVIMAPVAGMFEALQSADAMGAVITNSNLDTSAGELGGAFATWASPTWTNLTVGNGTETARYYRSGKYIFATYQLIWGSTTAISGTPTLAPPVAARDNASNLPIGDLYLFDTSTATTDPGQVWLNSSEQLTFNRWITATGSNPVQVQSSNNISSTQPWTWATGDAISFTIRYEAA